MIDRDFIPLTFDCNDNCISCPVPRKGKRENPSLENIKKEIAEIVANYPMIVFNGGEPTLRKDLLEILKYTEKCGAKDIRLLTNAEAFYYPLFAKRVAKIRGLRIITTIYGNNSKIHDSITRNTGSFGHKITGLKNLIKNKARIDLRVLIHKMNYMQLENIAKFIIGNFNPDDFEHVIIMNPMLICEAGKNKDSVMEKVSTLASVIRQPVEMLNDKGFDVQLYHFPHCILPYDLRRFSRGLTAGEGSIIFPSFCNSCIKKGECSGIWRSYPFKEYNEFAAITQDSEENDKFRVLQELQEEQNVSGEVLKETARMLFDKQKIDVIKINSALLTFYPVVQDNKGHCGTCLKIDGFGAMEGALLSDFSIDCNLNLRKGDITIPYKNNRRMLSLYTALLNAAAQADKTIFEKYAAENLFIPNNSTITQIGFHKLKCIDYSKAKRVCIIDKGLFEYSQRRCEAAPELEALKNEVADVKVYSNVTKELLSTSDVLILSGSTISNGTFDNIAMNAKGAQIIVFGRSALIYPEALFKSYRVKHIIASLAPKNLLDIAQADYAKYIKMSEPGDKVILSNK
jgi:pyruvate-formate lyase-activating enzyme